MGAGSYSARRIAAGAIPTGRLPDLDTGLIFPKSFEPARRKRSVARRVLDVAVAQISL
jgi:hypothetical protein